MTTQERSQFAVMILLVLDDVVENSHRVLVAEIFELAAVVGDVAAFLDFETPQGHADAAGAARDA